MKTSSAKAKGRNLQKWVVDQLVEHLDADPEDLESRPMGSQGEDVIMGKMTRQMFPYSVECKKNKSFAIYKQYEQAQANCPSVPSPTGETVEPILFIEGDHKKPLVVLDMNHFFALLKYMNKLEEEGE